MKAIVKPEEKNSDLNIKGIIMLFAFFLFAALFMYVLVRIPSALKKNSSSLEGKLVINEVCVRNKTVYPDEDGAVFSWAELYNTTGNKLSLSGCSLSDKKNKLFKYRFAEDSVINPGEYKIIFLGTKKADTKGKPTAGNIYTGFRLSRGETLYLCEKGKVIDYVETPGMIQTDVSYGRMKDGNGDWSPMEASPASSNAKARLFSFVESPEFSVDSGFYEKEFTLKIHAPAGTTVYYTLDSSVPTEKSSRYTKGIQITDPSETQNNYSAMTNLAPYHRTEHTQTITTVDEKGNRTEETYRTPEVLPGWYARYFIPSKAVDKCMVVRAVAVDKDGNSSEVKTASYFVGYQNKKGYKELPVMSLVSDPEELFGEDAGIFTVGKTYIEKAKNNTLGDSNKSQDVRKYCNNYNLRGRKSERDTHIDYFSDKDGRLLFSQEAGLRLHGNQSRVAEAQKSMNLYARTEYDGNEVFRSPFFSDGMLLDTVTLMRGVDIRNYFLCKRMDGRDMSAQDYQMVQVFLDGEFWGLYAIQERYNSDAYMETHYNLKGDDYLLAKGTPMGYDIKNGDPKTARTSFSQLKEFAGSHDLSDPDNYKKICAMMDVESFIDCYAAKIYTGDLDWCWFKNQYRIFYDNKWHWMTYDIDYGAGAHNNALAESNTFTETMVYPDQSLEKDPLLPHLLKNDNFRARFVSTFMDFSNEVFNGGIMREEIAKFEEQTFYAGVRTLERYPKDNEYAITDLPNHVSGFTKECEVIADYFTKRGSCICGYMADYLGLTGSQVTVTIKNDTPEMGKVKISTITPELKDGIWSGNYYTDYPVSVEAKPAAGYVFTGWETSGDGKVQNRKAAGTSLTLNGNVTIHPLFKKEK